MTPKCGPDPLAALSNDKGTFPRSRALLSDEIEGHTDASGPGAYNLQLGEDRAMAVRNYLHSQHQIALNRMEVISYGEANPVTDNRTRTNRAMNRRVVIKVPE